MQFKLYTGSYHQKQHQHSRYIMSVELVSGSEHCIVCQFVTVLACNTIYDREQR